MPEYVQVDHDPFNSLDAASVAMDARPDGRGMLGKIVDGIGQTWPARMAMDVWSGLKAPGNALRSTPDNPVTTEQMIKPAADLAGVVMGGSYAAPAMRDASGMGIRAYHGSPHDFDRFDLSKIGTGEGAQAYGHGLYFAENPAVAGEYKKKLSPKNETEAVAQTVAEKYGLDWSNMSAYERTSFVDRVANDPELAATISNRVPNGRMYEVNINAHPNQFLDWDKGGETKWHKAIWETNPVLAPKSGETPEKARISANAAEDWLQKASGDPNKAKELFYPFANQYGISKEAAENVTRRIDLLSDADISRAFKNGPALAAEKFRTEGVPGIKYLDLGSRTADNGTRNFVVFDDKLIDILKKYGLAGLSTAGLGHLAGQNVMIPVDHDPFTAAQ